MYDNEIENTNYFVPYLLPETEKAKDGSKKTSDLISKLNLYSSTSKSSELKYCPGLVSTNEPSSPSYLNNLKLHFDFSIGKKGFGKDGKKGGWFGSALQHSRWKEAELRDRALPTRRKRSFEAKPEDRPPQKSRAGLLENWSNFDQSKNY
jgi:hypothetical protein